MALRSVKLILYKLAIVFICAWIICACGSSKQGETSTVIISDFSFKQSPRTTVNYLSQIPRSEPSEGWAIYTNANQISEIAFDVAGNLWSIGSGGVTRWNPLGGVYEKYTALDGLAENFHSALAIASDGKVWVGTKSGYLSFFDGVDWVTLGKKVGDTITGLATTSDGVIWIGTNQGVYRFDGLYWISYTTANGILDNYIQSVMVASDGTVWIGMMGGISYFDGKIWQSKRAPTGTLVTNIRESPDKTLWFNLGHSLTRFDGKTWVTYEAGGNNDFGYIGAIAISAKGELWFISNKMGLVSFDENMQHFTQYPIWNISSLAFEGDGNLWLGYQYGGISRFNDGNLDVYRANDGPVDNFIISSGLGSDGAIWFGTARGVSRYDGNEWQSYTPRDGLISAGVLSIAAASDGSVWFGTENGVSHFDGTSWRSYTKQDGLIDNHVGAIAITPDGTVWVATRNGLSRYRGGEWFTFSVPDGFPTDGLKSAVAWPDNSVWVVTKKGVTRFDGQTWVSIYLPNPDTISCIEVSEQGDLWMGTLNSGVLFLDGRIWDEYTLDSVKMISIDSDGHIQITTDMGDLQVSANQFWRTYTKFDGLNDNRVNKISVAPNGNVWVATDGGISVLKNGYWLSYTGQNGLGINRVRTIVIDSQGSVWVGMPLGGLLKYTPQK